MITFRLKSLQEVSSIPSHRLCCNNDSDLLKKRHTCTYSVGVSNLNTILAILFLP